MPPRILPIRRQTTAYDKSALRIRTNGRRIATKDPDISKLQVLADAEAMHIKPSARVGKNKNWIAADVYSFERVPERRDYDDDDGDESDVLPAAREKSKKREKPEPKTYDGKRRRMNIDDLSFISNPHASYVTSAIPESLTSLDPSTDLLKTIHHFTSEFYDASGQMVNATRKTVSRKKAKEFQQSEEPDSGNEKSAEDDEGTDAEGDHKEGDPESKSQTVPTRKSRHYQTKQRGVQKVQEDKDMYAHYDGSALFCLGMLFKAHIYSQLESSMPESWDDEVAAYKELQEALYLYDSDKESEEEEEENSDGADAEKEMFKRWENETLASPGRYKLDDLKVDFISPEYSCI